MKKALLVVLSMIAIAATAQNKRIEDTRLKALIIQDVCDVFDPNHRPKGWVRPTVQDMAERFSIPTERMARVLEEIIRESLDSIEKAEGKRPPSARYVIYVILRQLKDFRTPDTLDLLRECALSTDAWVCYSAAEIYITFLEGGGDSAAFLQKVHSKGLFPEESRFFDFLQGIIEKLKEKGQNDDVEKLHAVMLDMMWTEQEAVNAARLDKVLCATLDGYEQSIQREQTMQRLRVSVQEHNRKYFDAIKTEIEALPAEKRTDLSKRFKAVERSWEEEFRWDIRRIPMESSPFPSPIEYAWGFTNKHEVSSEQMSKVLEEFIRENLHVLEKTSNRISPQRRDDALKYLWRSIGMLRVFHNSNTLELLKECMQSKEEKVREQAMITCLRIDVMASIPIIRDAVEKGRLNEDNRLIVSGNLALAFRNKLKVQSHLKEHFFATLADAMQTEKDFICARWLDGFLCETLNDYVNSIQRMQAAEKFLTSTKELERNHFNKIKAEVDAIPADKRTDLSRRFKLTLPPQG